MGPQEGILDISDSVLLIVRGPGPHLSDSEETRQQQNLISQRTYDQGNPFNRTNHREHPHMPK